MITCSIVDRSGTQVATCSADDVLRSLSNGRQREVITVLERMADDEIDRDRLRQRLAERANGGDEIDWRHELRHVHVPMLDELGIVTTDEANERIRYHQCELVSSVLDVLESGQHPDREPGEQ